MNYNDLSIFSAMKQKMLYLSERQAVLAQNVANADTPGYKARDLKAPDFKGMTEAASRRLGMTVTNAAHIRPTNTSPSHFQSIERRPTWETTPSENTVAIDEEVKKIGLNQSEYQQVTALYRKTVDMFKIAIGRPGAV